MEQRKIEGPRRAGHERERTKGPRRKGWIDKERRETKTEGARRSRRHFLGK